MEEEDVFSDEWTDSSAEELDNHAVHTEFANNRVGRHSTIFSARNVRLGSHLGEGAFGNVCKGYVEQPLRGGSSRVVDTVAVKVISKRRVVKRNLQKQLAMEIAVHQTLKHPNIVRFHDFSEDRKNVYFYLEFAPEGDLLKFVETQQPNESDLSVILYQIGQALDFCHGYGVVHRDVKPENILIDQRHTPKLTDFGYCDQVGRDGYCKNPRFCGTTDYMAPEMVDEKPCSYPLDVWAFGVMIFDLLCGEAPFQEKDHNSTYHRIRNCDVKWNKPAVRKRTQNCIHLLKAIFVRDPRDRPTMQEVLRDHWFQV